MKLYCTITKPESLKKSREKIFSKNIISPFCLFFLQAPQVEKESGAEREEDIGDSQEPLWTIPQIE